MSYTNPHEEKSREVEGGERAGIMWAASPMHEYGNFLSNTCRTVEL